tara:strand:+ start:794 stop:1243 length:450 start_codon:yes stop_codon:yes gene_type:complete
MVDYLKQDNPIIESIPLFLRDNKELNITYDRNTCNVSVKYCLYDKKKKRILKISESRALSQGLSKLSIHAEEMAIRDIIRLDPKNKCDIYIWKYGKGGEIKTKYCCKTCTDLLKKYKMGNRVYTFKNGVKVSALIDNPEVSIGNMIRKN